MKTKCKECGAEIWIEKGEERICDDCWQHREEMHEETRLIMAEVERNKQKFMTRGYSEQEALEKALFLV